MRIRTRTCKLILEDPEGQGLSLRATTLAYLMYQWLQIVMYQWKSFFTITSCTVAVTKFKNFMWYIPVTDCLHLAECGVLDNFRGLCAPRTRTWGPRTRQGLVKWSSRTRTFLDDKNTGYLYYLLSASCDAN